MKKPKFEVPAWVPLDAWNAYIEMRKETKKPMTEYAKKLAINKLAELMRDGHTPTAVLEQSIFYSWQGLFPIKTVEGVKTPFKAPEPESLGVKLRPEAAARLAKRFGVN